MPVFYGTSKLTHFSTLSSNLEESSPEILGEF